jgi:hypothetical protein
LILALRMGIVRLERVPIQAVLWLEWGKLTSAICSMPGGLQRFHASKRLTRDVLLLSSAIIAGLIRSCAPSEVFGAEWRSNVNGQQDSASGPHGNFVKPSNCHT